METLSVAETRAGFSSLVARFRAEPDSAPIAVGPHRKPAMVLLSLDAYRRLDQEPPVTLDRLRELKPVIERIAQCAHVTTVQVFGSVARGEQKPGSDVDLLVEVGADATLFDIAQFELDMEVLLRAPVSAVSRGALDPTRDARILAEAVEL